MPLIETPGREGACTSVTVSAESAPGGLAPAAIISAPNGNVGLYWSSKQMVSVEVVEVNPGMDEVNRTADLAVELVMPALGKRIL